MVQREICLCRDKIVKIILLAEILKVDFESFLKTKFNVGFHFFLNIFKTIHFTVYCNFCLILQLQIFLIKIYRNLLRIQNHPQFANILKK